MIHHPATWWYTPHINFKATILVMEKHVGFPGSIFSCYVYGHAKRHGVWFHCENYVLQKLVVI
jgi:hypothetical protein